MAAGFRVIGFDIERHSIQVEKFARPEGDGWVTASTKPKYYPGSTRAQGRADGSTAPSSAMRPSIVASPPCQNYSYLAMPWSRSKDPNNSKAAKALRRKWETEGPDNRLFDACFRIQREAIMARWLQLKHCCTRPGGCWRCYIPLIVENVRGAQPWVGRSAWNYGSFHLWGDVPALMPFSQGGLGIKQLNPRGDNATAGRNRMGLGGMPDDGQKIPKHGSGSNARKAASAQIAKIPFELARHIAAGLLPERASGGRRPGDFNACGKSRCSRQTSAQASSG